MVEVLKSLLCGCNLRQGTCIIGTMQSVFAFTVMIISAIYSQNPSEIIDTSDDMIMKESPEVLRAVLIVMSIFSAIQVVFSIMIVFGARTERPVLLLPWMIFHTFILVVYAIGIGAGAIGKFLIGEIASGFGTFFGGIVGILLGVYMIAVVYSLHEHLKRLNF